MSRDTAGLERERTLTAESHKCKAYVQICRSVTSNGDSRQIAEKLLVQLYKIKHKQK
jgi:hypothetical protein